MQILGIGITRNNLNSIVKNLQKNLSHQLNSELFSDLCSDFVLEIEKNGINNVLVDIIKNKPDLIILNPDYLKDPHFCIKLIDGLKKKSDKILHFVMVFENLKKNINPFLKFIPEFELVNKMKIKFSSPELILEHNLKRFPRVRLNSEFLKMNYRNNFGDFLSHSPDQIPIDLIIPFNKIEKFETDAGEIKPNLWLKKILKKNQIIFQNQNVKAILREQKGCYLFPGVPFNSILNVKFNSIIVEHLILQNECNINSPPFKRLIKSMKKGYHEWLKDKKDISKRKYLPIFCLINNSGLKDFIEDLFNEIGYSNVKIISEIKSEKKIVKKPAIWLKLSKIPSVDISEINIDWSVDVTHILTPLNGFVDLNELENSKEVKFLPIQKTEFEKIKKKLSNEENKIKSTINQEEIDEMLNVQELDIFKKLNSLTQHLLEVLSNSRSWEDTHEKASKIKQQKILLLCEEENYAAELNLKLKNVQRKLWINPLKFKKPEDLIQLNTKMIKSYLKSKVLVIDSDAKDHLEKLCKQTNSEYEIVKNNSKETNLKIKHSKTDLSLIQKNKKLLALRWLNVSFKQLLYRDRHLFKLISEKVA